MPQNTVGYLVDPTSAMLIRLGQRELPRRDDAATPDGALSCPEFLRASAERKKEILTDFYDTNREWLDPSAIMHLGSRFGFKAKLFKKEHTSHLLRLDAQTQDGADIASELPYRLMVHVNDNHYDLLYPLNIDGTLLQ